MSSFTWLGLLGCCPGGSQKENFLWWTETKDFQANFKDWMLVAFKKANYQCRKIYLNFVRSQRKIYQHQSKTVSCSINHLPPLDLDFTNVCYKLFMKTFVTRTCMCGVHLPYFLCCLSYVKAEYINSKMIVKSITSSICVPVPKGVQFCPCQHSQKKSKNKNFWEIILAGNFKNNNNNKN